jgi:beta-lactam-binding protein with PASTA domain
MITKSGRTRLSRSWFLLSVLAPLVLAACGGGGGGSTGTPPPPVTQVPAPNVQGLTQAAATTEITGAGLVLGTVTMVTSATVPSGSVISQSPATATNVAPGSSVNLTVSTGPAITQVAVPNVEGMTQAAATTALGNVGLTLGTAATANSATVSAGSVINQSPPAGTEVASGSAVDLTISSGATTGQATVPNVVGMTQAAATTAIMGAGLALGTVTMSSSPTVPAGSVISQNPAAAVQVASGSAVNVTVSSGTSATQVTVPNVVGSAQAAATSAITGAGLMVGAIATQPNATVVSGLIISQSPAAGSSVTSGSSVSLVVSSGVANVTVPNVVGLSQSAAASAITGAGLTIGSLTTQSSATVASGLVIAENPTSGSKVSSGSAVSLVVSSGAATTVVPNVVGLTQAAAVTAIVGAGLVTGTVTFASSATVPVGNAVGESPVAGTNVATGSAVNLSVSTGPATVSVPNVVGLTQAAATTSITSSGLILGTVATASSTTVASGNVISQSPTAASSVASGSAVNLTVSSGGGLSALPGDPTSSAMSAISDLAGSPFVSSTSIDTDPGLGSITRGRLELMIQPSATVGQVNAAISSVNGTIITMVTGYAGIVVEFPDPGTIAALQSLANSLSSSPGIASANEITVNSFAPEALPANNPTMNPTLYDLAAVSAPAVWNTAGLLTNRSSVPAASGNVTYVQLDFFGAAGPGAGIAASQDPAYSPFILPTPPSNIHGYAVLSRALFDFGGDTTLRGIGAGIAPFTLSQSVPFRPVDLRDYSSVDYAYDDDTVMNSAWLAIKSAIKTASPPGNVVFNASLGACPPPPQMACNVSHQTLEAVRWLSLVRGNAWLPVSPLEQQFIVTTSAGNAGTLDAAINNPWSASALLTLSDPVLGVATPSSNVLVVESNYVQPLQANEAPTAGCRSTFSSWPGNIAAFGESLQGQDVLFATDGTVDASQSIPHYSGTSFASPQVAGLALYMWRLNPSLPASSIVNSIIANASIPANCQSGGSNNVINAYSTVLSLDQTITTAGAPVRMALLDVTDVAGTGPPDGQFTSADFLAFITAFAQAQSQGTPQPDFSRYDLNGDGFTGGTRAARFDLNAQYSATGAPVYGTLSEVIEGQSVQFNENNLTDLQVLCYYAYSSLMSPADQADIPSAFASVNQQYGTALGCVPFVQNPLSVGVSLNLTDLGPGVGSIVSGPRSVNQSCSSPCGFTAAGGAFNSTAVVTDTWTQYAAPNITLSSSLQGNVALTTSSSPMFSATANWSVTAGPFEGNFSGAFNFSISQPYAVSVTAACTGSTGAVAIPCGGNLPAVDITSIRGNPVQAPAPNQYIVGPGTYNFGWGLVGGTGTSCCIAGNAVTAAVSLGVSFQPIVTVGPVVTLTANPASVTSGNSSTITWTSSNAVSCSAPWTTSIATSGTASTGPLTADTTYSMTCTDSSGATSAPVSITVPVTRVFNATFTYEGTIIGGSGSAQIGSGQFVYDTTNNVLSAFSLTITNQSAANPNQFIYALADVTSFSYSQVTQALNLTTRPVAGTNSIYLPQLFNVITMYGKNAGNTATQAYPTVPETSGPVVVTVTN